VALPYLPNAKQLPVQGPNTLSASAVASSLHTALQLQQDVQMQQSHNELAHLSSNGVLGPSVAAGARLSILPLATCMV
jgi:hypothetical protein